MKIIGGKIAPDSSGQLVAYVAEVYRNGLVNTIDQVCEGKLLYYVE